MGCNRLAIGEDKEAADFARSEGISYRQALNKVVERRYAKTLAALADDQQRMKRIRDVAERAAEHALWSKAVIENGGYVYSDGNRGDHRHKSDYGEGATALRMFERGFEPISFGGPGSSQGIHGIDSIWVRDETYFVVESKAFTSKLRPGQMAHEWIQERFEMALGGDKDLARHIIDSRYMRMMSHSDHRGVYKEGYLMMDC
jgi:hypothetical protein